MIMHREKVDVRHNLTTPQTFKMNQSADAFRILSSQLYSNPIKAIVRELTCNAIDAVKCINGDPLTGVDIVLPNAATKQLIIKDAGVGMDDQEVMDLYTTYFGTSKNQSNDFIGALGLGSKSPFSYTDRFVVQTSKHKIERTYMAFLNDEGFPQISLINTQPTDTSGTSITIDIKNGDDVIKFRRAFLDVSLGLGLLPTTDPECLTDLYLKHIDTNLEVGQIDEKELANILKHEFKRLVDGGYFFTLYQSLEFTPTQVLKKDELNSAFNHHMLGAPDHHSLLIRVRKKLLQYIHTQLGDVLVNMGGVLYPVNTNLIVPADKYDSLTEFIRNWFEDMNMSGNTPLIILKADIGDLSIAPSREELHYDTHTIATLRQLIWNAYPKAYQTAKDQVSEATLTHLALRKSSLLYTKAQHSVCKQSYEDQQGIYNQLEATRARIRSYFDNKVEIYRGKLKQEHPDLAKDLFQDKLNYYTHHLVLKPLIGQIFTSYEDNHFSKYVPTSHMEAIIEYHHVDINKGIKALTNVFYNSILGVGLLPVTPVIGQLPSLVSVEFKDLYSSQERINLPVVVDPEASQKWGHYFDSTRPKMIKSKRFQAVINGIKSATNRQLWHPHLNALFESYGIDYKIEQLNDKQYELLMSYLDISLLNEPECKIMLGEKWDNNTIPNFSNFIPMKVQSDPAPKPTTSYKKAIAAPRYVGLPIFNNRNLEAYERDNPEFFKEVVSNMKEDSRCNKTKGRTPTEMISLDALEKYASSHNVVFGLYIYSKEDTYTWEKNEDPEFKYESFSQLRNFDTVYHRWGYSRGDGCPFLYFGCILNKNLISIKVSWGDFKKWKLYNNPIFVPVEDLYKESVVDLFKRHDPSGMLINWAMGGKLVRYASILKLGKKLFPSCIFKLHRLESFSWWDQFAGDKTENKAFMSLKPYLMKLYKDKIDSDLLKKISIEWEDCEWISSPDPEDALKILKMPQWAQALKDAQNIAHFDEIYAELALILSIRFDDMVGGFFNNSKYLKVYQIFNNNDEFRTIEIGVLEEMGLDKYSNIGKIFVALWYILEIEGLNPSQYLGDEKTNGTISFTEITRRSKLG